MSSRARSVPGEKSGLGFRRSGSTLGSIPAPLRGSPSSAGTHLLCHWIFAPPRAAPNTRSRLRFACRDGVRERKGRGSQRRDLRYRVRPWKALISRGLGGIGFVWSLVIEPLPGVERSLDAAR